MTNYVTVIQFIVIFLVVFGLMWNVLLKHEQGRWCMRSNMGKVFLAMHFFIPRIIRIANDLGYGHLDIRVKNKPSLKSIDFSGFPGTLVFYNPEDNTIYLDINAVDNDVANFYKLTAKGVVMFLQYASHYGYPFDEDMEIKYGDVEAELIANVFMRTSTIVGADVFSRHYVRAIRNGDLAYQLLIHEMSMGSVVPLELNPLFGPIAEKATQSRLEAINARIISSTNYVDVRYETVTEIP